MPPIAATESRLAGARYAALAYLAWGFFPLYWKPLHAVPAVEVLAHRIVWAGLFLTALIAYRGKLAVVYAVVKDRSIIARLALSTALIGCNWYVYIWAVANGHVLDASFGYFITPLVNASLGIVFLRERPRRLQIVALLLALSGVMFMGFSWTAMPWVSLILALSFGTYGLVRKTTAVDAVTGLLIETGLLAPLAGALLLLKQINGSAALGHAGALPTALLLGAGIVTAVPLLWFANAARLLPLMTLGFFQYIAPSVQLALGIWIFGEAFSFEKLIAFALIWAALVVFSLSAFVYRAREIGT